MAEMAAAASEFGALSLRLVQTSMAAAKRSNTQRTRVQDVARMEQQIQASARRNGVNSRETAQKTEAVSQDTDKGQETMEATTVAMQQMVGTVSESATLMREFVTRMAEVNRIVGTISEIARQTNLLALNAAIEAAHAGSDGDGFTVIAQEVRLLADRAGQSTMEVTEKVGKMAASALAAERAMLEGQAAAEKSIHQNAEVQRSFRAIRDAMHEVQAMSAQVADASEKQLAAGERVSASVSEIDGMALECTQEADASAEMSIRIVECAAQMQDLLGELGSFSSRRKRQENPESVQLIGKLEKHRPAVERGCELLQRQCVQAGNPAVRGTVEIEGKQLPALWFGGTPAAEATSWVDSVKQQTGCLATIFVRDGSDFVRVVTNVLRPDGKRAVGTVLNPKGMAIGRLQGKTGHQGAAYILGKPFTALYEPVLSLSGEVIGALYVGHPVE
jgi:hypothetical protein